VDILTILRRSKSANPVRVQTMRIPARIDARHFIYREFKRIVGMSPIERKDITMLKESHARRFSRQSAHRNIQSRSVNVHESDWVLAGSRGSDPFFGSEVCCEYSLTPVKNCVRPRAVNGHAPSNALVASSTLLSTSQVMPHPPEFWRLIQAHPWIGTFTTS
jgi:hypothetical protein